ncbi:MAG: ParB/RepB/Spo0J family partition protein [Candidatus Bathyarchaeia archaeon]
MDGGEIVEGLRFSGERVGWLYPVLLDKYGNVVDGLHRLEADPNWPKMRLDHIESDEQRLVARLIANVCRRNVPAGEKRRMLEELGELYVKTGVKPGAELARKISEVTSMSLRWVMIYLPDRLKERPGVGGPSRASDLPNVKKVLYNGKVARLATESFQLEFFAAEPADRILTVKKYANTDFVQVMLEKRFYEDVERLAENLGATAEIILNNVLVWALKKLAEFSIPKKLAP